MGGWKVIIVSALSLSLRDKDRLRDWEIERAWQLTCYQWIICLVLYNYVCFYHCENIKFQSFLLKSNTSFYLLTTTWKKLKLPYYYYTNPNVLFRNVKTLILSPSSESADDLLVIFSALSCGDKCKILSNDKFRDHFRTLGKQKLLSVLDSL